MSCLRLLTLVTGVLYCTHCSGLWPIDCTQCTQQMHSLTPSLFVRSFARGITCRITLYSWRAQGAALHVFDAHGDAVRSVTFSADSKYTYQADSAT